jgi:hypothetical protein
MSEMSSKKSVVITQAKGLDKENCKKLLHLHSKDCKYVYLFSLIINVWPISFKFMFIPHEFFYSRWIYI